MPLPILPIPAFPTVPPYPGVPLLARAGTIQAQFVRPVLLVADAINFIRSFIPSTWGLYDEEGVPLLLGDNVSAVDYKAESRLADYPIEKGGFASYNKVQTPYDARATFTVGGSDAKRTAFLTTLDKLLKGLTIVSLVTSDVTYSRANVVHYDYRRTSKGGVTLLSVDVWLMEVRLTAGTSFADADTAAATGAPSPQQPSGASPVSAGTVQAATPTAVQTEALPPIASATPNGAG